MDESVRHLRNWCTKERELLQASLEQMQPGLATTHGEKIGGVMEDTTDTTIEVTKAKIGDLDALLAKIKVDHF